MSLWQLAIKSLQHFWRTNLALLLGIAVGTAVLTGALIVGDSIRNSLKSLTLERLGHIDEILLSEQFFRAELADSLAESLAGSLGDVSADSQIGHATSDGYADVVPVILLSRATVEVVEQGRAARAQGVTIVAADAAFWKLDASNYMGSDGNRKVPGPDQIVINQSLADELDAKIGDKLLIRIGKPSDVGADSPLARKDDLLKSIVDLELIDIIPSRGLGRFSLQASQQIPANAFTSLATLQSGLDQPGKVNALLVSGKSADKPATDESFAVLRDALRPTLEDLGLSFERIQLTYQDNGETNVVAEYDTLTNARMLFSPENDDAVLTAIASEGPQSLFTYLSTKMQRLDSAGEPVGEVVPYSMIAGVDSISELGPLLDGDKPIRIATEQIVLNRWAADVMKVSAGDRIRVSYFEPETTHGETVETSADFQVQAIVDIATPARPFDRRRDAIYERPPALVNDPDLTPNVPGITDAETVDRWDAPFELDLSTWGKRDDDYWANYRTTPKAFVSVSQARQMWGSRFGQTTSFRLAANDQTIKARSAELAANLMGRSSDFGMHWLRAKRDGLAASKGTTPFDGLFFGFSMFIIASALMLVALLLRLSLEQRASQIGLIGALGFDWKQSLRVLLMENGLILVAGSVLGVLLGIGYAWLMLAGLRTWWVEAVVTPFMQLSVQPKSLVFGLLLGIVSCLLTIYFTLRRLRNLSVSTLMAGQTEEASSLAPAKTRSWMKYLPWGLLGLAAVLGAVAPSLPPEPQGGAFFGSGACVLTAILLGVSTWLTKASRLATDGSSLTWQALSGRNLTRNPTRSTLTIGLVASACFLIVAISAFRLQPTDKGTGGFELMGQSDQPIYENLLEISDSKARVFSLRLQEGDDASCRNLYQSARPRLIGITQEFIDNASDAGEFEWAGRGDVPDGAADWNVLAASGTVGQDGTNGDNVIPVVLDKNTAMYSMQIYTGVGTEFERDYGLAGKLKFRIVGLLSGSTFQGSLLIPEASLKKYFPRNGGYRYFLVDVADGDGATDSSVASIASELEERFSDQGLDLTDSKRLLTELLAVQNTYLSTFQSLGGLGLLLGTFGLAAVQLRNVMQRKGELALMRATGFSTRQLSKLVLWEHALLLFGGLGVGVVAALVVVLPHMMFGGAKLPFGSLVMTLGLVAVVGILSAYFAQRYVSKTPLMPALRGD